MQLKTYSARSTSIILAQIKEELGPDAVILDSTEENGVITMTAALERKYAGSFPAPEQEDANFSRGNTVRGSREGYEAVRAAARAAAGERGIADSDFGLASGFAPGVASGSARDATLLGQGGWPTPSVATSWQDEWGTIKDHLMALMKPALGLDKLPSRQRLAMEFIQREGVGDDAVFALHRKLQGDASASILTALGEMVTVRAWGLTEWPQRVHLVAGPFGAGKTSVAVRMALLLRAATPKIRVCMINADAGRGNGRLLLRHYSELSELGYKEAATTMELVAAVNTAEREGFERILVDLPGLSRGKFLATLLADAGLVQKDPAVHLTLPPHYSGEALKALAARYASPCRGSIIWTKLDEAEHYGQIVNVALQTGLPTSGLSFGAGLGNSLVPAHENLLWKLLFKRELPG